ncbi:hypothetical protein Taro_013307 [Colocasia esculenta]|uniref:Protein EARLY HEADING DATE 2 n=1 Tax=Colocasia esculenta TaxID=4460 RepID=A0A843UIC5_COLES|nr:hypothetical protein [Colocasia esculenta]
MAGDATSKALQQVPYQDSNPPPVKKKRNLPGTPDPDAEVIALSPKTLLATNRFLCEICGKGFQRDQNLQLHRRGHNLPWKLKQRSTKEPRKRVYVCPEKSCVHHHPSRALGDLTGIKKHFCRKHGEKKWKCDKCSKRYAVQSDWKAHMKTCGTREYRCDCGTLFSRRDSFITHRAFCDALAEETARLSAAASGISCVTSVGVGGGYHLAAGGPMRSSNLVQHLSSIFKPVGPAGAESTVDHGGLSLWAAGQGPQGSDVSVGNHTGLSDLHPLGALHGSANLFGDPFASCLNPQQLDYQLSCVYGNKVSPSSSGDLTGPSAFSSAGCMKEASGASHNLPAVSVPSLYSTQHQQPSLPAPDMSATALLQKAAQIGVASSEVVPSFLGSLDPKCSSGLQAGEGSGKYDSFFALNPTAFSAGFSPNSINDVPFLNQLQIFSARQHVPQNQKDDAEGGQTRDFLGVGVGVQGLCPPSIHGWI